MSAQQNTKTMLAIQYRLRLSFVFLIWFTSFGDDRKEIIKQIEKRNVNICGNIVLVKN